MLRDMDALYGNHAWQKRRVKISHCFLGCSNLIFVHCQNREHGSYSAVLYSKTESVPKVMCEVQSKFQQSKFQNFQTRTWLAPLGGSQDDYNRSCLSPETKLKLDLLGSGDTSASCNFGL